ncbi:MAG TPA: 2Fe-2S iron-sulfur cluster-binding protein [Ramlibacter sp.]|nr:2Fe-2S iron-sulfur cluster-binding protein [Ramlibacter sp.]
MSNIDVTWVLADGRRIAGSVPCGHTLMEAALAHNVPGVLGECGGAMSCATCHIVVESAAVALPPAEGTELEMIELTCMDATPASRLSCQLRAGPELQGLVLRVPQA